MPLAGESRDGLLLRQKLKMDNKTQQQQVRRETSEEDSTNDERVEADMVDHLTCESLRSCSPSVHVRGLALCLPPLSAFTIAHRSVAPPPAPRTRSGRHSESRARSRGAAAQ
ncbi:unnamed protein product [Pleuronectes platessa]|uniref:Uncharacterized protein n=1 Tax=Pleuronectes platessa TaxID=8262 RepID=A0A9N7ZBQ6_PLEPL|nr:unnamed protein product [Pleuronectes platessa]